MKDLSHHKFYLNSDTTSCESKFTSIDSIPQDIALESKLIMKLYLVILLEAREIHMPLAANNWLNE